MSAIGKQSRNITISRAAAFQYLILFHAISLSLSYLWPNVLLTGSVQRNVSPRYPSLTTSSAVTSNGYRIGKALSFSSSSENAGQRAHGRSKRRKPPTNRVAIQWVFESVEKVLTEESKSSKQGKEEKSKTQDSLILLEALSQICHARSKAEVNQAGDSIASLDMNRFSYAVQERVMKGIAMAGLVQLSIQLLDSMLLTRNGRSPTASSQKGSDPVPGLTQQYVPSSMSYVAIFKCLRKRKRLEEMRETLQKLKLASQATSTKIDTIAFNIYLAALCDVSTKGDKHKTNLARHRKGRPALSEAIRLLGEGVAEAEFELIEAPGIYAFNTVLHAAASLRNITMAQQVVQLMDSQNVTPDIYSYNALLRTYSFSTVGDVATKEKIKIIDKIFDTPGINPDKYTIENSLLPLSRVGRIGDILSLLKDFNSKSDHRTVSNEYATFLHALVKGGEVQIARAVLDTFILPSIVESERTLLQTLTQETDVRNNEQLRREDFKVPPISRHFNALLEGYSILHDRRLGSHHDDANISPSEHAHFLFGVMKELNIKPDAYTITIMLQFQKSSKDIVRIWEEALHIHNIVITVPIYHALLTSFGRVNDPSSCCMVFDLMLTEVVVMHVNSWNVLLSALSKASHHYAKVEQINCDSSIAATELLNSVGSKNGNNVAPTTLLPGGLSFRSLVDGLDPVEASERILQLMRKVSSSDSIKSFVKRPNAQSYCSVLSALSQKYIDRSETAMDIYHDAMKHNVYVDGRFINAVIRCYGDNIEDAIKSWKSVLRHVRWDNENKNLSQKGQHLVMAYNGLVYVSGRAGRPDIALRLTFAMMKDGIEPKEMTLNCYNSGARIRKSFGLSEVIRMMDQYENLLTIECTKYNQNDERRKNEKRLRIIL